MQGSGADGGKKHTIDSDEEEEMNNAYNTVADHDKMKEDDIEGKQLSHFQPHHLITGEPGQFLELLKTRLFFLTLSSQ